MQGFLADTGPVPGSAGAQDDPPERIGPYEIREVLGEGGMGIVYRAEQTDPIRREVAIKLIRGGLDRGSVLARFQSERQALAVMDHPHIAKVFGAGTDESGHPYFVMECVRGRPITRYCEEQRLPVARRLDLLRDLCRGVHHAHQKGIIHRDLKPSNLLVTEQDGIPVPKIIDFGIAKAIENPERDSLLLTREGQILGTLKYMSPEQARGNPAAIDTRSDVYSLGVVLYELITGSLPYETTDGSLLDQIQAVCERAPRPFADVTGDSRDVDDEIETIARKALEKEPERRYQSAAELADDLERYRTSQPILARPPSAAYQLRKLIARNRLPSALIGSVAVLLVAFGIGMSVLYARADRHLRRAVDAEGESSQVSRFLVGLFALSRPEAARGDTVTAREILDRGAERVSRELADQPRLRARMLEAIGVTYRGLGLYDKADSLLGGALDLTRETSEAAGLDEAEILLQLGRVSYARGDLAGAEDAYAKSLAIRRRLGADRPYLAAEAQGSLGWVYAQQSRLGEAEQLLLEAVRTLERTPDPNAHELPTAWTNLALVYQAQGRLEEAETLLVRSLARRREIYPESHPEIAGSLRSLASLRWERGRPNDAEPLLQEALEISERVYGPSHPEYGVQLMTMASLQKQLGRLRAAELAFLKAIPILEGSLGPVHGDVAIALNNLGMLYREQGRLDESADALERSLAIQLELSGPDHPNTATALNNLGEIQLAAGREEKAADYFERALAIRTAVYGVDNPSTSLPMHNLGLLRLRNGRLAEADSLLRKARDVRVATLGPTHVRIAESQEACAELARRLERPELADSLEAEAAAVRGRLR